MKIGLVGSFRSHLDSLKYSFTFIEQALGSRHELIYLPQDYSRVARERQEELLREWLLAPDVLVGLIDPLLLQIRNTMARRAPFVVFLLGTMPRGAPNLRSAWKHLGSSDPLICNCLADKELTHKFFPNAHTRMLPLAFDESLFYPLDSAARQSIRAALGFGPADKILLCAGRMTLEKNVHTVLRIFSVVEKALPNAHLIVAGSAEDTPFFEFGVSTPSIQRTLVRLAGKLGIPTGKLRFAGHKSGPELRELYNISDLQINMTLHHDENFGLAQVESMACGTPVVVTNWGGLKDTVVDGETGARVSTFVTSYGVKVDWYQAAARIVALLSDPSRHARMRGNAQRTALQKYSRAVFQKDLEGIVAECSQAHAAPSEALHLTDFARRFWQLTMYQPGDRPAYRRSRETYEMYRSLIGPYGGPMTEGEPPPDLAPHQVLCLANPVALTSEGSIRVEDPIFPFEIALPRHLQHSASVVIQAMTLKPQTTVERLIGACLPQDVIATVHWMVDAGIILASATKDGAVSEDASAHLGASALMIQGLDSETDAIFMK